MVSHWDIDQAAPAEPHMGALYFFLSLFLRLVLIRPKVGCGPGIFRLVLPHVPERSGEDLA